MKIREYQMMTKQLTKPNGKTPEQNRLADLKRNLPNQKRMLKKRNELGIDTTSLQDKINKAELELEQFKAPVKKDVFEKIGERIIDGMVIGEDLDPKEQIVKYDSATGLFSNNKKDIGFKDVASARKHNEVYEKYVPEIQNLKKAVTPKVKPKVKAFVKPKVYPDIPKIDFNYTPYRKDDDEEFKIAEAKFNKILEEDRIKKEKEATQGLPGIIPSAVRRLQEQEKERRKIRKVEEDIKPTTRGGNNDKPL